MIARSLVTAGIFALVAAPAGAQQTPPPSVPGTPPSIANYFVGAWWCSSALNAQGAKIFGLSENRTTLFYANPFVSATGRFGMFVEHFTESAGTITVIQLDGPSASFQGSSSGWSGDVLQFVGTQTRGDTHQPRRETFRRVDDNEFTQVFEDADAAEGPWTATSSSTCRRVFPATLTAAAEPRGGNPELMRFVERVAGAGPGSNARVYVGTLPDGFSADVPLPLDTTLVGSVQRATPSAGSTALYYDVDGDAAQVAEAYAGRLRAAGWAEHRLPAALTGGFARLPDTTTFCADGKPAIIVSRPNAVLSRALNVTVSRSETPLCSVSFADAGLGAPLPRFVAPRATQMIAGGLPSLGSSAATLTSTAPLGQLLDAFVAQMQSAHWSFVDKAVGKRAAVASFTITDAEHVRWDAALTLTAADDKPDTYYASVSTAKRS